MVRLCFFADTGWCSGTAARVAARLFTSLIGVVDLAVWYRPVCAMAARERVQIWSPLGALGALGALVWPARRCRCCSMRPGAGSWRHGSGPGTLIAEEPQKVELTPALYASGARDLPESVSGAGCLFVGEAYVGSSFH